MTSAQWLAICYLVVVAGFVILGIGVGAAVIIEILSHFYIR